MVKINTANIDKWLANGAQLGETHIKALSDFIDRYPYYGPPHILLAKALFNIQSPDFERQLRKAALCTDDRLWLYNFIHQKPKEIIAAKSIQEIKKEKEQKKKVILKKTITKKPTSVSPKVVRIKKAKETAKPATKKQNPLNDKVEKRSNKKSAIKRIKFNLGEGEVLKNQAPITEELKAIVPKLKIEKEDIPTDQSLTESSVAKPIENHSFLDWLDYTSYNNSVGQEVKEVALTERNYKEEALDSSVDKTMDLLAKFIADKPKPGEIKLEKYDPEEQTLKAEMDEEIPVSETLAHVYLEQDEIEMAIEVYHKLILKFPEKSTYFANLIQELNNK